MTWYTGNSQYDTALTFAFGIVAVTAVSALFVETPYGRFADDKFGVGLDPRLGWFLMELPAPVTFVYFYLQGPNAGAPVPLFILFVWGLHYANRGFIMPALMRVPRGQKSTFSLSVVVMGWLVTCLHGYLNGSWASTFSPHTDWSWFTDPRFIIGVLLYYGALMVNLRSDQIVRNLRTREEVANGVKNYRIPRGGLFEYVTNPSYFSEIVFWIGFALFTWSLAGVYILAISMANLIPRAISTHAWYREKFADYPERRKILIPYLW
jgi:3-oxo-5-alpha-steroid 4-dehydrogenase 1